MRLPTAATPHGARARAPWFLSVLVATTLSACGSTGGQAEGDGFVVSKSGVAVAPRGERRPAPELAGDTVDGTGLDLNSPTYKGKVVVLNVWASWCAPCRAEAGRLAEVSEEMRPEGVEFVGINTRDPGKGAARAFEEEFGIGYPSLHDPTGKLLLRFPGGTVSPQGIPSTVVLDKEGRIAARKIGEVDERQLRRMIDPLLAEN